MLRFLRVLALLASIAVLATSIPAGAATPTTSTISLKKRAITWQGAKVTVSSIAFDPIGIGNDCNLLGDPFCDHFFLKIDLGDGAKVRIQIKADDPADPNSVSKPYDDFDVYIYAPGPPAAPIASGETGSGNETVTFVHKAKYRNQNYDIAVRPWLVLPGHSYTGVVSVISTGM